MKVFKDTIELRIFLFNNAPEFKDKAISDTSFEELIDERLDHVLKSGLVAIKGETKEEINGFAPVVNAPSFSPVVVNCLVDDIIYFSEYVDAEKVDIKATIEIILRYLGKTTLLDPDEVLGDFYDTGLPESDMFDYLVERLAKELSKTVEEIVESLFCSGRIAAAKIK